MLFCKLQTSCFSSFNQVISLHPNNSVEHWTSHTEMYFLVSFNLTSPYTISLSKTALSVNHSTETQKTSFVPLCCYDVSNYMHFFTVFKYCRTIVFLICMIDFTAKMLRVIYFVIRCEAKFPKKRLEIFKCTRVK